VAAEVIDHVGKKINDSLFGTTTAIALSEHKGSSCYGTSAVLRMSFTLTVLHVLILILISPRLACCSVIHDGIWPVKILFVIGLYIGSFWIPQNVFQYWAMICRCGSVLFLMVQGYFLLNNSYILSDNLTNKI